MREIYGLIFAFLLACNIGQAQAGFLDPCGPQNIAGQQRQRPPNDGLATAARAARQAGDFAQAVQIYSQIDQEGESAALNLPSNYPWREQTIGRHFDNLAFARYAMGVYSEEGKGGPRDFNRAVQWYVKSSKTVYCNLAVNEVSAQVSYRLARLFYYGKGVPVDRQRAKALWKKTGAYDNLVALAERDALPPYEKWDGFDFKGAYARLQSEPKRPNSPPRLPAVTSAAPRPLSPLPPASVEIQKPPLQTETPQVKFKLDL